MMTTNDESVMEKKPEEIEELERLAMEELIQEAKRAAERAKDIGVSGWLKPVIPPTNKRFLHNTLASTLRRPLKGTKHRIHSSSSDYSSDSDDDRHKSKRSRYHHYGGRSSRERYCRSIGLEDDTTVPPDGDGVAKNGKKGDDANMVYVDGVWKDKHKKSHKKKKKSKHKHKSKSEKRDKDESSKDDNQETGKWDSSSQTGKEDSIDTKWASADPNLSHPNNDLSEKSNATKTETSSIAAQSVDKKESPKVKKSTRIPLLTLPHTTLEGSSESDTETPKPDTAVAPKPDTAMAPKPDTAVAPDAPAAPDTPAAPDAKPDKDQNEQDDKQSKKHKKHKGKHKKHKHKKDKS